MQISRPVEGPITQHFGENPGAYARWGRAGHNGIDWGIPVGTPIKAAADGIVTDRGNDPGGYGWYVTITHTDGSVTHYAHMHQPGAQTGTRVLRGDVIGISGNTGNSTGPHLHFEYRTPAEKQDGYPAGERDPMPFFVADPPARPSEPGATHTVKVGALNIRQTPSVSGPVMGQLQYGTEIAIVERKIMEEWGRMPDGTWVALKYQGVTLAETK